ncbi:mediator of RNA polymerase II transcription subunit 8-like [Chlorella sorokiniana]|uniref:Mediator of RNA polymerase II transcription subunit 8-like n=1 Tax=Chlorella sorokiniana TaxID=3076 RepID=A0A2P6TYC0_CHLSO|nr:mediator of RNA polymerase II transcription subunit 8-like [Chlorella sorokiniana]|eukprot:PRW59040.1 mediator of RNA polymerase II transcription subunit 8-like [Chlorella sorokiniana]
MQGSRPPELRELLMGHGQGQLHLSAVRARAEELKRSLDQIIQSLQFAADRVQWSDALDRFAVINVQYQHLVDALRPLLRQFAAYPRSVNQTNAPILPIMLATKLLPEMEAEEASLLAQLAAAQQPGGSAASAAGTGAGQPPALSVAEQFAWVQDQERQLNHLVDQLVREEGGPLGAKGERRRQLAAAVAQAAAAGGPATAAAQPPGPQQGGPQRQAAQPPDPLLAAVTSGVGL